MTPPDAKREAHEAASMPETLSAMETVSMTMTHHMELHKSSSKVQSIGRFLLVATFQAEMSCMVSGRLQGTQHQSIIFIFTHGLPN